jgi:IPT/TIG domain/PASTA domain
MRRLRIGAAIVATMAFTAVGAASAQALTTVGQLAPSNPPDICTNGPFDILQFSISAGNSYVVPSPGGLITSWSTNAGEGAGQTLKLKVFRHTSGSNYTVVAHDGPRSLTPSALNTFAVQIPVQAGDLIGLNDLNASSAPNACAFGGTSAMDSIYGAEGDGGDGASEAFEPETGPYRLNLTATVQPPPTIASISPASGPTTGGTAVTISGQDFTGATAVAFGAIPAAAFTVDSDTQITAASPPAAAGAVGIAVATPAGQSSAVASDMFTFVVPPHCVVPKLAGKTLKAAHKKLKRADCKLGKVSHTKAKHPRKHKRHGKPRIVAQHPKAGKVLAAGAKVNVKLSR